MEIARRSWPQLVARRIWKSLLESAAGSCLPSRHSGGTLLYKLVTLIDFKQNSATFFPVIQLRLLRNVTLLHLPTEPFFINCKTMS